MTKTYKKHPDKKSDVSMRLVDTQFSDYTLSCGGHEFEVHRAIMSDASDYFLAVCSESSFAEGRDARCEFPEEDPSLMCRLIIHQYTGDYFPSTISKLPNGVSIPQFQTVVDEHYYDGQPRYKDAVLHIKMYELADMYDLPYLKDQVLQEYVKVLQEDNPLSPGVMISALDDSHVAKLSHIVEALYVATFPDVMALRIPLLELLHVWITHGATKLKTFRQLVQDNMQLGVDFTNLQPSSRPALCQSSKCGAASFVILGECACGKTESCDEQFCKDKWTENKVCPKCLKIGKLLYPEG